MKTNGNDQKVGNYYLGLDVGTNSVGWAVTTPEYELEKAHGNAMWGIRLFEEAKSAADRRSARTSRRRLERRNQRLTILALLFAEELDKKDPYFLKRLSESDLWLEDKHVDGRFSLFNDKDYTDKDYHKQYPTAYHLRKELLTSTEPHDIRLVYLAIHHIMKLRGHFLYESDNDSAQAIRLEKAYCEFKEFLFSNDVPFEPQNENAFLCAMQEETGITAKKKNMRTAYGPLLSKSESSEYGSLNLGALLDLLAGASVNLSLLFSDDSLKNVDIKSIKLSADLDSSFDDLSAVLESRVDFVLQAKAFFDAAKLSRMLEGFDYLSEAKVDRYNQNKKDLSLLKKYVRLTSPDKYKEIFSKKSDKLNNFVAYSGYKLKSGDHTCTQEEFCTYLSNLLFGKESAEPEEEYLRLRNEIKEKTFLPKLRGPENGVVPYQLNRQELVKILENASSYLPFLLEKDADGLSVNEKILATFEFKIPYYVGPLHPNSGWAVRFPKKEHEKIYPWNFSQIIDTEQSATKFIENLVGLCTYTGEKVLPKDSLLYSEYTLLNEMNCLKINGNSLPQEVLAKLIHHFFYDSKKKVTKKQIQHYLVQEGEIESSDELSGIDDTIKSSLRSYHDFKSILDKTKDTQMIEEIIKSILVFGDAKNMLRKWLKNNTHGLSSDDINYICRLKYKDWGRLSKTFLTDLYSPNEYGEALSIMDRLRAGEGNLMQLMSSDYEYAVQAQMHRDTVLGNQNTLTQKLDSLYIAPAVRRSIRQTMRIVDEIVDIKKSVPSKIFIEMARENAKDVKKQRTESRKAKLLELYKSCKSESDFLFSKLQNEDENRLRSDKLYLYYAQLGKCMYSGEPIDLEALLRGELYDIDHIFPRSKIKDDSLSNRVLVKNTLNREKDNTYPISAETRQSMTPFWKVLKEKGLISEKKYERLVRSYPLTDQELSSFVARQLVETQQSTKALAWILKDTYGDSVRIVYSKAGNVSDFRHSKDLIKCREVNDLHHAKDAYLNIVVGNVYDTKFTANFFNNIHFENYSLNKVFDFNVNGAWDVNKSISTVRRVMSKNNVLMTRMPYEVKGSLFDLQLMPAGKGQLQKKKERSITKYGGYNKISGAYYCVVEHTSQKKRIRTIEPVYVYTVQAYESNPIKYCASILGLTDPVIICKKILFNAMLEINGERLLVSGRTGNSLVFKHSYPLVLNDEDSRYIKSIQKHIDRCKAQKREIAPTEFDGISEEKNIALYELFLNKCSQKVYSPLLKNMKSDMEENFQKFKIASLYSQECLLLEILKAFQCNSLNANFTDLCGKGVVGRIVLSHRIDQQKQAYLINQSVTGLYEVKVDLLK